MATGVKEALAAGGFETIAAEVGEHSFTTPPSKAAIFLSATCTATCLRGFGTTRQGLSRITRENSSSIATSYRDSSHQEGERRFTTFSRKSAESIVLAPLRSGVPHKTTMSPPPRGLPTLAAGTDQEGSSSSGFFEINAPQFPQVILSVRLQSSESSEARAWVDWLLKAPPEAEDIKVEGWFGSFSTLIILNVPLKVWHAMPNDPAMSFVGFVTTENLASALLPNKPSIARWLDNKTTGSTRYASSVYAPSVIADSAIDIDNRSIVGFRAHELKPGANHPGALSLGTPLAFQHLIQKPTTRRGEQSDLPSPSLSCPFRKRNRLRFNVRDHQSCAVQFFSNINHLK
jgi:hypothetical protein